MHSFRCDVKILITSALYFLTFFLYFGSISRKNSIFELPRMLNKWLGNLMRTGMALKKNEAINTKDYKTFLQLLKEDIQQTQVKAALSVTKELIMLYWRTGKMLAEKVNTEGWGAKTLERLAREL